MSDIPLYLREASDKYMEIGAEIKHLRATIEGLERKKERLWKEHNWIKILVGRIEEIVNKHYPEYVTEILGPFGLGARTSIHIMKEHTYNWVDGNIIGSLTFEPDVQNGTLLLVKRWEDTGAFREGTTGSMNGFNHPTMPLPDTEEELLSYMKWPDEK